MRHLWQRWTGRFSRASPGQKLTDRSAIHEQMEAGIGTTTPRRPATLVHLHVEEYRDVLRRSGTAAGEELLDHVETVLLEETGARGSVARLGPAEYAMLLRDVEPDAAQRLLDRARSRLQSLTGSQRPSLCSGAVTWSGASLPVPQLVQRASQALYDARRDAGAGGSRHLLVLDGGETVVVSPPSSQAGTSIPVEDPASPASALEYPQQCPEPEAVRRERAAGDRR